MKKDSKKENTDLGIGAIPRRIPPARISDFVSFLSKQITRITPRSSHLPYLVFIIPETVLTLKMILVSGSLVTTAAIIA